MMHKLQMYMSDIGEDMEKEGDATKNYQSLKTRVLDDMHFAHERLERQREYDENSNPPMDEMGERIDMPPMTDKEIAETKQFLVEAQELVDMLDHIIGEELNHTVLLVGKMVKYGCVRPGQENLANAIQEICMTVKPQEGDDGNGSN